MIIRKNYYDATKWSVHMYSGAWFFTGTYDECVAVVTDAGLEVVVE